MVEMLTYAALAECLGFLLGSRPSAGKAVAAAQTTREQWQGPHWPLTSPNSTTLPCSGRAPDDHRAVAGALKARIETLEAELARLEAAAAGHRADFERERERCDGLMAEVLKTTDLMSAREAAARVAGELEAFQARPWWRRLAG